MQLSIHHFDAHQLPEANAKSEAIHFLSTHLEQYGDPADQIEQAVNYALGINEKPGGCILIAKENNSILGAAVVNKTGMEGYIPENILVYIATHNASRGKGVGKALMQYMIENVEGNIALHVEPDNPAKMLYEKLGFTNKYLEMRLAKTK